jgi:heme-degrading monooxygenase HmoA
MHARLVTADIPDDGKAAFLAAFNDIVLPDITQEHGYLGHYLLHAADEHRMYAVMLWDTLADAEASAVNFRERRGPMMMPVLTGPPAAVTAEVLQHP